MKFKNSIALVFILTSIFLLTLTSFVYYKTGERFMLKEIYQQFEFKSAIKFKSVDKLLINHQHAVNHALRDGEIVKNIKAYLKTPNKKNKNQLRASLKNHSTENLYIQVFDQQGQLIANVEAVDREEKYTPEYILSKTELQERIDKFALVPAKDFTAHYLYKIIPLAHAKKPIGYIQIAQNAGELITHLRASAGTGSSEEFFLIDKKRQLYLLKKKE